MSLTSHRRVLILFYIACFLIIAWFTHSAESVSVSRATQEATLDQVSLHLGEDGLNDTAVEHDGLNETETDHFHQDTSLPGESTELSGKKPWVAAIFTALLVNVTTLVGLALLTGQFLTKTFCAKLQRSSEEGSFNWKFADNIIPSFASGALLATTFFLIIPESLFMIIQDLAGEEEEEAHNHRSLQEESPDGEQNSDTPIAWRFGLSILGGLLIPIVSSLIFPHYHEPELCEACMEARSKEILSENDMDAENPMPALPVDNSNDEQKVEAHGSTDGSVVPTLGEGCESAGCDGEHHCHDEEEKEIEVTKNSKPLPTSTPINYTLAVSVLLGDFFHNFTDGILLGTAFLLCGNHLAITIAFATIYHELAMEVADFLLLTQHCNIRPCIALLLNFLCGLSVMIGACLILAFDISSNATGCILAMGGGVYVYVAGAECIPRAKQAQKNITDKILSLASFAVGIVPIGMVLLNHGECAAG